VPDPRTQTYQVAEVAFAPDGLRGTENLLFNGALAEIPPTASFLGRWHQARVTYDMTRFTGTVWIDNVLVLGDVPLRQDFDVQARPEISFARAASVPIMLWVDDMEVGFQDISLLGKDPTGVEPRRLFRDNFNGYESALFPRQGGWIARGDEARQAEALKAESAVENAVSAKAVETDERPANAEVDDRVYASSAKSFRLKGSSEEPVTTAKPFSIPARIPYCVNAEPFAIIAAGEAGQAERDITSSRGIEKKSRRQKRWDDGEASRTNRTSDRQESANVTRAAVRPSSSDAGTPKSAKMMSVPATGTYFIYAFDGRLLAEYDVAGQLVRDYVYFSGQLVAEYRNQDSRLLYYASDHINSTRIVTDNTGSVVYAAAHEPYGGIQKTWVSSYDPSLKFSGKQRDAESDLDYFGARYYDRSLYRFLGPDPIRAAGPAISNPQRWHLYSYCLNNPLSFVDPNGATAEDFIIIIQRKYRDTDNHVMVGELKAQGMPLGVTIENTEYMLDPGTYYGKYTVTKAGTPVIQFDFYVKTWEDKYGNTDGRWPALMKGVGVAGNHECIVVGEKYNENGTVSGSSNVWEDLEKMLKAYYAGLAELEYRLQQFGQRGCYEADPISYMMCQFSVLECMGWMESLNAEFNSRIVIIIMNP
jgi:RHS repeat-associated protein